MGFKEIAIARNAGEKMFLKCLSEDRKTDSKYYIIPKKLGRDVANEIRQLYRKMFSRYNIEPDPGLDDQALFKLFEAKAKVGKVEGTEIELEKIAKLYFLHGIHEHNLDDDKGQLMKLDQDTYIEISKIAPMVIDEINQIVRDFQKEMDELLTKKDETSSTPSSGDLKE